MTMKRGRSRTRMIPDVPAHPHRRRDADRGHTGDVLRAGGGTD